MALSKGRALIVYLSSFALGRGALFGAPILLANLLAAMDYGHLEMAQAAGSILSSTAALGTASALPLVLLGHSQSTTLRGIVTHHLLVVGVCFVVGLLAWLSNWPDAWPLGALFAATITLQSLGSTHLKTLGRSDASVLLDAGMFGSMALAATAAHFAAPAQVLRWVCGAAFVYAAVLAAAYLRVWASCKAKGERIEWVGAMGLGLPLMLGGIVSLLATTSGRLGMGLLAGPLATADYAVLARAAALPIVAHQLILVAKFRNLFSSPHAEVERATVSIVIMVAASAAAFVALLPWLGELLGPAFVSAAQTHRVQALWIAAQAILWSAIALNDLVIARHQAMARILPYSASLLAAFLAAGWFALHLIGASLANFVHVHGTVMLAFYLAQSMAMRRQGLMLWHTWLTSVATYAALLSLTLFY